MFVSKERIERELKDEEAFKEMTPKERRMFIVYCTNGFDALQAYNDVYAPEDKIRIIKFPGSKAETIVASENFEECLNIYGDMLKELAATRVNSEIFLYWTNLSFYDIFDYIDIDGSFKYESIDEAREILGPAKCAPILSIVKTLHPKDPSIEINTVNLFPREKALKELQRFSQFYKEESTGATAMPNINIDLGNARFDPKMDEVNASKYKIDG